jgi:hypothetical protein
MAVASRWNSTVDVAQVACLTIATSSHRGVVQSSATGVWAGSSTCGAILSKGHQRVALLLSKGVQDSRQAVRLEQLAHSHFLPFLNRNFLQHRGAQSRVQIHIRYGSTRRAWCDRHNRQGRHQRPSLCSPHRGVAINRPATGVWRGGDEARLPGLPLGAPAAAAWPSLPAGVAGGATTAGSEPNGICARRVMDRGRDAPKFAKYKIWGPIRNLGPVSESKKRKGKTSQILWLNFSGAH